MKKITITPYYERREAEAYFKGFDTGVFNTLGSLIKLHKEGKTSKEIYKLIDKMYKQQCERRIYESNNQRRKHNTRVHHDQKK